MTFSARLLAASAVLAALASPLAASPADLWVASATEKIRPDAQPGRAHEARIAAAKNEFEAFQIVVRGPARGVTARAEAFAQPGGARIDGVRLYREALIDVGSPSALDGGTGRWPDALVPAVDEVDGEARNAFPFDVPAGESRAIWVEVHVPAGARAGGYAGSIAITADGAETRVPVALEVWGFELPSTSSLRTHFGLGYGLLQGGHAMGGEDSAVRVKYATLALDHRVSLSGVADDGMNVRDFEHLERVYGPLIDGTAKTALEGARLTTVKYVGGRTSLEDHRAWAEHAKARGWMDRLFDYTCDEPPLQCGWDEIGPRARAAHDADPAFRTLVTTQLWDAEDHDVAKDIDIMVPVVNFMDDKPGSAVSGDQRARYDGFLASAPTKELWLYESCMSHGCGGTVNIGSPNDEDRYFTGWPTYMIDASAVRNRAMEWISFLERASGELYWETGWAFQQNPWTSQWDFSGNGDGTLFYPGTPARIGGTTDVPVASIRLKMIREGMEDYEYLKLLADAGQGDTARKIARDLFPSASGTEVAPEKLYAAREQLAVAIMAAHGTLPAGGCSSGGVPGPALLVLAPLLAGLLRRRRLAPALARLQPRRSGR
ncbi:MAG: DUF4091 domain-containing protein [Anaeromyxobacteraceae bacterium]